MITAMKSTTTNGPLPFVGQETHVRTSEFRKVLKRFSDRTVFVNIRRFGLLLPYHKQEGPSAAMICGRQLPPSVWESISRTDACFPTLAASLRKEFPATGCSPEDARCISWNVSTREKHRLCGLSHHPLPPAVLSKYTQEHQELGKLDYCNNMQQTTTAAGLSWQTRWYAVTTGLTDKCRDSPGCHVFLIDPLHGDGHHFYTGWT